MTLQKFSVLKNCSNIFDGPFCNKQYSALAKKLKRYKKDSRVKSQLELEVEAESLLKRMLIMHIKYSWLEVCRKTNKLYNRYRWVLPEGIIELMKPIGISGSRFKKWLKGHIIGPNPNEKGEKFRIQREIDNWFGHSSEENFDNISYMLNSEKEEDFDLKMYPQDFSSLVANEKAENINQLRPSIQLLGSNKVRNLVLSILENIIYNDCNDNNIASRFGLSKATFSRFAGRDWRKNNNGDVPDLWRNIAQIVTNDPVFIEIAVSLGINSVIKEISQLKKRR